MSVAQMSLRAGFAGPSYVAEDYPLIRSVADPSIANLPTEDLEAELFRQGIRAEAMENFFSDIGNAFGSAGKAIGNVASTAAPIVAQVAGKALPGVISGAATGCALGPWGCLGGALVGGVTSALSGGGGKPASPSPSGIVGTIASAAPAIASAFGGGGGVASGIASALPAIAGLVSGVAGGKPSPPAAAVASTPPAGSAAPTNPAGVLLGLVQRPEVIQSLMSMALGSSGRKDVPVGNSSVPVSAFANLLGVLGSKAFGQAEASAEPSESLPDYLYKDGDLQADPADRSARAAVLLERLGEVAIATPRPAPRFAFSEADEYYDELDAAELDLMEMEGAGYEFHE
jgi:hypothetical protein